MHLAKRLYDEAITTDPGAYFPAMLALFNLGVKMLLAGELDAYFEGSPEGTAAGTTPAPPFELVAFLRNWQEELSPLLITFLLLLIFIRRQL